eukprot:753656-Hanusia_phi.AAC.13
MTRGSFTAIDSLFGALTQDHTEDHTKGSSEGFRIRISISQLFSSPPVNGGNFPDGLLGPGEQMFTTSIRRL